MTISSVRSSPYPDYDEVSQITKVHSAEELDELKKEPTKVVAVGDVYTSSAVHFKELSLKELTNEAIDINTSEVAYVTHTDGSKNMPNRIVVIRDPANNNKYMILELSKKSINQLHEKFTGANNFFERTDGALRLNGEAEAFVAGWLQNIKLDRHYDKSDIDGNGLIEGDEAKTLMTRFEGEKNYDYIGKKIIKINLGVSKNYQPLDPTDSSIDIGEEASSKHKGLVFDNSVEKALEHTLQMDADLDGIVTQEEMLIDTRGKDYRKKIISETEEFHQDLLDIRTDLNDETKIQKYDFGHATTKEEQDAILEQMRESAIQISTEGLLRFANQNGETISFMLDQLHLQTAQTTYSNDDDKETNAQYTTREEHF